MSPFDQPSTPDRYDLKRGPASSAAARGYSFRIMNAVARVEPVNKMG